MSHQYPEVNYDDIVEPEVHEETKQAQGAGSKQEK
jgi:hypothetical protein